MRYTVLWSPKAESELAELWIAAADRAAITEAANRLDRLLANDPDQHGESRSQDLRIVLAEPLGVDIKVLPDDRQVYVVAVWSTGHART